MTPITLPVAKPDLENYLPHKGPMLLIDRILEFSLAQGQCTSEVDITAENPFFDRGLGLVPTYTAFEFIAQTIAAFSGLTASPPNRKPRIGMIMGLREFHAARQGFAPGTTVRVQVGLVFKEDGVFVFEGTAVQGGETVVKCVINTIEPSDELFSQICGGDHEQ